MYDLIQIYKAGLGSSVIVNELTGTLKYPVRRFEWNQPTRGDALPKMQQGGQHDRYMHVDAMTIVMEGDILGNDTTEYWVNRKQLMNVIIPDPTQDYRYHSQIRIRLDDSSTIYYANVTLEDYDAPTEAFYPTRTPFMFQWVCPFGYWRKLSDNSVAYI